MTVFVRDEFNGTVGTLLTAHTPDVDVEGGGWSVLQGPGAAFTLDGSGAVVVASNSNSLAVIDPGASDFKISGKVTTFGETNNRLLFRVVDVNNYWVAFLERFAIGGPIIRKVVAGSVTNVAFFQPPTGPFGAGTVQFEIEANGPLITYRDLTNDQFLFVSDPQFQSAKLCGFGDELSDAGWLIDYLIESPPVPAAPAVAAAALICVPDPWVGGDPPVAVENLVLFFDNFVAPDGTDPELHTPTIDLSGNGWDRNGENWEINSNAVEYVGIPFATTQLVTDIGKSDNIAVSVKVTRLPDTAGSRVGVVLRFEDFLDAKYIEFKVQPDNDAFFIRANNGGGTLVSGTLATSFAVGDTIELRAQGTFISAFHNGVLVGSAFTTSFQTETEVGIYVQDEGGIDPLFDDFKVIEL